MTLKEEYEQYREEARRRIDEDNRTMIVALEHVNAAMWRRIEALEAANKELRIEIGKQSDRMDTAARKIGQIEKQGGVT